MKKAIYVLLLFSLIFCMPVNAYSDEEIALHQAEWLTEHGYQISGTFEEIDNFYKTVRYGKDIEEKKSIPIRALRNYPIPTPKDERVM